MRGKEFTKVAPEAVSIGDTIEVIMPSVNGITTRKSGTVAARESYSSGFRTLYTREGGELYSWLPGKAVGAIFRTAKAIPEQITLPGLELDRLAG